MELKFKNDEPLHSLIAGIRTISNVAVEKADPMRTLQGLGQMLFDIEVARDNLNRIEKALLTGKMTALK